MKRRIVLLALVLVFCLMAPVAAQTTNNIAIGAFVEKAEDTLFLAQQDGIYAIAADGKAVQISQDRASYIQYADGYVYYCQNTYQTDEFDTTELVGQTPKRMLPDGTDVQVLGDMRAVGYSMDFQDDSQDVIVDARIGYYDFTVLNGSIYFLGNTGKSGEYTCTAPSGFSEEGDDTTVQTKGVYTDGIALMRMDAQGGNETVLTDVLGNSIAQMSIAQDKIYIASGYADVIYAYNFVNYAVYDLEGNVLTTIHQPAEAAQGMGFTCDKGEFYHITQAVQPYEDTMLISLGESEGDFVSSQAFILNADGTLKLCALEFNYMPALLDAGLLYYLGTESEDIFYTEELDYDASLGVYVKNPTDEGMGTKLFPLTFDEALYETKLNVVDGYVYLQNGEGLLRRVPAAGGTVQTWNGTAFA